jgi:hypothetical protein
LNDYFGIFGIPGIPWNYLESVNFFVIVIAIIVKFLDNYRNKHWDRNKH